MKMKQITILTIAITLLLPSLAIGEAKNIDEFSNSAPEGFPKGWRTRPGQGSGARQVYKIKDEGGNKYLAADDPSDVSIQIFKMTHWDLSNYPLLQWKWRARKLPVDANETIPARNDSACGVYVSFGMVRGKALKYVWSTSAPVGTFYKKNDDMYIIVKRSGGGSLGGWVSETANVLEDAKKAFGSVPDRTLSGVGILTDGNATHTPASCDYDSIGYATD